MPSMMTATASDQHDQRYHQHGVEHQVAKIQQVAARHERPSLRRPQLLDGEDDQHKPITTGPISW